LVVRELRKHKRKLRVVEITGNVTGEDRTEAVRKFQESEADYCVFTMGAGGEGITLTRASRVVFLQRSFSLVQNKQAEDRLHRIGQEAESVQVIDIIAADTIDADVREALVVKGVKFEEVVRDEDTLRAILRRKAAFS
jgi:SWI/SNF-related matrix-associated actin-dependent regulator 1 of chromatin subfamily A